MKYMYLIKMRKLKNWPKSWGEVYALSLKVLYFNCTPIFSESAKSVLKLWKNLTLIWMELKYIWSVSWTLYCKIWNSWKLIAINNLNLNLLKIPMGYRHSRVKLFFCNSNFIQVFKVALPAKNINSNKKSNFQYGNVCMIIMQRHPGFGFP